MSGHCGEAPVPFMLKMTEPNKQGTVYVFSRLFKEEFSQITFCITNSCCRWFKSAYLFEIVEIKKLLTVFVADHSCVPIMSTPTIPPIPIGSVK
jgi:hypothetical protein